MSDFIKRSIKKMTGFFGGGQFQKFSPGGDKAATLAQYAKSAYIGISQHKSSQTNINQHKSTYINIDQHKST